MRLQSRYFSCGPAACHNIAALLEGNKAPSEDDFYAAMGIAKDIERATSGSNEDLLIRALRRYKYRSTPFTVKDSAHVALAMVDRSLLIGVPLIVCVMNFQHWSTIQGRLGLDYLIVDSANPDILVKMTDKELLRYWVGHDEKESYVYYGMSVCKMKKYS